MQDHSFSSDFAIEAAKGTPPVAASAYLLSMGVNEWVAVLTGIFVLLQTAYLIWKWRREAQKDV